MTDKTLKEQIEAILHLNGCQQRTAGYNEAISNTDMDNKDMERLEKLTLDEVMQAIQQDRERAVREGRIAELKDLVVNTNNFRDSKQVYITVQDRIIELKDKGE